MSHEIANVNGQWSFAHVGERGWHGLGQKVRDNASLEEWAEKAGLLYKIEQRPLYYRPSCDNHGQKLPARVVPDRIIQVRMDTGLDLGIVGSTFQTDQPIDNLHFFQDWIKAGGAKMETAGALFGGRQYFASARIGDDVDLGGGDSLRPFIMLTNACDGSRRRDVRNVMTRPVCNNTVTAALAESKKAAWGSTHRSKANWDDARQTVEAALVQFGAFVQTARALAKVKASEKDASAFLVKLLDVANEEEAKEKQAFGKILALFNGGGAGSKLVTAKGTRWGLLNAVTDYVDHGVRARSDEHRFASAQQGPGAALKSKAVALLTA